MTVCDICRNPSSASARVVQLELYSNSTFQLTAQLCPTCRTKARDAMKAVTLEAFKSLVLAANPQAVPVLPATPQVTK